MCVCFCCLCTHTQTSGDCIFTHNLSMTPSTIFPSLEIELQTNIQTHCLIHVKHTFLLQLSLHHLTRSGFHKRNVLRCLCSMIPATAPFKFLLFLLSLLICSRVKVCMSMVCMDNVVWLSFMNIYLASGAPLFWGERTRTLSEEGGVVQEDDSEVVWKLFRWVRID